MTSTATKKKYGSYQEMVEDVTTLKEQNHIYEPKFEQSQAVPKETNTKSIITSFISQLRPGADLSRIQAPMFVIKPKSFLEVTSDYVAPHSFMIKVGEESAPEKRIALLGKWVLSNLSHTVQKGFARMKPFNPILGEQFLCQFNHEDSTTSFVAEQTSHHPPITSLYMENKKHNWVYTSTTAPKSTFLGNKVAMTLEGEHSFHLLKFGEVYNVTWPNIVGRGILLGTSMVENTDSVKITCEKTGYELKAELKKKGNDIEGYVKNKEGEIVYKITGNIEGKITFVDQKTKAQDTIDVKTLQPPSKIVKPLHEQLVNEARRVWHHASFAIYEGDLDTASKYKHFVEEEQRKHAKARKEKGEKWIPTLFKETSKKLRNDAPVFEYKNINLNPTSSKHEDEALLDLE